MVGIKKITSTNIPFERYSQPHFLALVWTSPLGPACPHPISCPIRVRYVSDACPLCTSFRFTSQSGLTIFRQLALFLLPTTASRAASPTTPPPHPRRSLAGPTTNRPETSTSQTRVSSFAQPDFRHTRMAATCRLTCCCHLASPPLQEPHRPPRNSNSCRDQGCFLTGCGPRQDATWQLGQLASHNLKRAMGANQ